MAPPCSRRMKNWETIPEGVGGQSRRIRVPQPLQPRAGANRGPTPPSRECPPFDDGYTTCREQTSPYCFLQHLLDDDRDNPHASCTFANEPRGPTYTIHRSPTPEGAAPKHFEPRRLKRGMIPGTKPEDGCLNQCRNAPLHRWFPERLPRSFSSLDVRRLRDGLHFERRGPRPFRRTTPPLVAWVGKQYSRHAPLRPSPFRRVPDPRR